MSRLKVRGFTLVELVVAITIVGIVASTVMGMMSVMALRSSEVVVSQQAGSIANAYLQEVMSKKFDEPSTEGTGPRWQYDEVTDYNGIDDAGAKDQYGNAILGLEGYRITVGVTGQALGAIPIAQCRQIVVTVTDPLGEVLSVTSYKVAP